MAEIIQTLQNLGMEEQEVKTYLALLDLGESTATSLAERTGLGRVHMYQIVNWLIEKGLASYIIKNNVKYFSASAPEILLKDLHQKEQDLQKILPELKGRQMTSVLETKIEVYRSREGVNTILKIIIKDKKPYCILGGAQEACSLFKIENMRFIKQSEKLKLHGRILARKKDSFFVGRSEDYRFIPENLISSTTQMIWGNKTAIFIWSEPYYAILIDNKEVTRSNLITFNYLWRQGKTPLKSDRNKRRVKL